MVEAVLNSKGVFIAKVRGKENAKTIALTDAVCEFCNIKLGDVLQLQIQEIKKGEDSKVKKK